MRASLAVLRPLLADENALEPERVSEKLHQNTFWLGRGGSITHTISGIDIALWDILGKATGQPVGRLLGGRYRERVRPYASLLMDEPEQMARSPAAGARRRGSARSRSAGDRSASASAAIDEAIVRAAREAVGPDSLLMVDAGGSDAFWPHGLQVGAADRGDAGRLRCRLVRGAAAPRTRSRISSRCAASRRCRSPAARC